MDKKQFENWVHKFGMLSGTVLLILMVIFPILTSLVTGVWPDIPMILPAILSVTLMLAPWWPAECFGYMTTMGPGALYLSYITGNVTNLRMPATIGTMNALEMEPNTDECHTMAIIACGASNFTTIILLAIGLVLAVPLKPVLEAEALQPAFNFAIPALFGGVVAQSVFKSVKSFLYYLIPAAVAIFFCFATPAFNTAYVMLICTVIGAAVYYIFDYLPKKKAKAAE